MQLIGGRMENQYEPVGKWISVLYRQFQVYINKELKDSELNSAQFIFLINLYRQDGVNQEELATKLFIDKGAAARAIKQLESNGYIERQVNPEDKRAYKIYITEKAKQIKPRIQEILNEWNETLIGNLSQEEEEVLLKALKQMSARALQKNNKTEKSETLDETRQ